MKTTLSQALVDALGAAAAVLVSFLAQEALSIARYRDATFGAENAIHRARDEAARQREAATAVSESLAQVPHLNSILVGQLGAVTSQTESAAFSIVERLQSVDTVVQDLDHSVQTFSQESGEIVEAASARAARMVPPCPASCTLAFSICRATATTPVERAGFTEVFDTGMLTR